MIQKFAFNLHFDSKLAKYTCFALLFCQVYQYGGYERIQTGQFVINHGKRVDC